MRTYSVSRAQTSVNLGLRAYFVQIYRFMSLGLCVSALCAWLGANTPLREILYSYRPDGSAVISLVGWIVILSPLFLVWKIGSNVARMNVKAATSSFYLFAALNGLSLSSIFLLYAPETIFSTFLICATMFAAFSLYGQTTQRDLSSWGSVLSMGVFGLILAMLVNMFMHSPALAYAVSIIGVVIFSALMIYDTQRIRQIYNESTQEQVRQSLAVLAALSLYLDFINLFLFLLSSLRNRQ